MTDLRRLAFLPDDSDDIETDLGGCCIDRAEVFSGSNREPFLLGFGNPQFRRPENIASGGFDLDEHQAVITGRYNIQLIAFAAPIERLDAVAMSLEIGDSRLLAFISDRSSVDFPVPL